MANILVIGGSRGIGRALVEQLLQQHHAVWLACREPDAASDLHGAIRFRWDARDEPFPHELLPERLRRVVEQVDRERTVTLDRHTAGALGVGES